MPINTNKTATFHGEPRLADFFQLAETIAYEHVAMFEWWNNYVCTIVTCQAVLIEILGCVWDVIMMGD